MEKRWSATRENKLRPVEKPIVEQRPQERNTVFRRIMAHENVNRFPARAATAVLVAVAFFGHPKGGGGAEPRPQGPARRWRYPLKSGVNYVLLAMRTTRSSGMSCPINHGCTTG